LALFIPATGNLKIMAPEHMKEMKNYAIVGNVGHYDNEIEVDWLENRPGSRVENLRPRLDRFVSPDGHGVRLLASGCLVNLGGATGHPSFLTTCFFTNLVSA
jgi:adenosylhomocysteinase